MDGGRSNKGENDTTGFDFQHYTLLYCIEHLRKHKNRFPEFKIGSAIDGFGALDDIVLHVALPGSRTVTNLLQVKHSTRTITDIYLCDDAKTCVLKYFKTFLFLKKTIPLEQLEQLIIWTNMSFAKNVQDWFEKYVPTDDERDILKNDGSLPYERFRFKKDKFKDISESFLDDAHPRTTLIDKFVHVLFEKKEWSSKYAAKSYYRVMAKEIIECNGVNSKFKEHFITGEGLLPETVQFRKYFEVVMKAMFIRKKIGSFTMADLNSDEYKTYYQVMVDADFTEGTKADVQWKKWEHEPQVTDLEEFRQRFIFYVKVPISIDLEKFLITQVGCFKQLCEILKQCAFKKMIDEKITDKLFLLMKHRENMVSRPYTNLQFDDLDVLQQKVIEFMQDSSRRCLHVKAVQDVQCSGSRLISPIKNCLAPLNERYLVVNCSNFYKNWDNLQAILKEKILVEIGLKCIIITEVPKNKLQDIETKLSTSEVKAILVGGQLDNGFEDKFDISTLHPDSKDIISSREIFLSEQQAAKAGEIYGNELFRKENYRLALDLFQIQRPIQLEGNELQLDEHFRERQLKVEQNETNVLDLIRSKDYQQIVVSDQAGMGKSTELINIAVEMRKTYKDHLVVCLDCKGVLRHHGDKEDFAYIVCQMTNIRGGTKEVVVRKIIELGKMILLLDGIDEVSGSCRTNLEAMLNTISKTRLFKLVIATRPHCNTLIQKILPLCIICKLEPFSTSDQLEYLMSFWKVNDLADENDHTEENAIELINRFRSMLKDGSLIGIPLQTYMIAVIYQTSIMAKDFEQPKPYEIGNIYKQFIELKFQESIKRQFDLTSKAHENAIRTQQENFIPDHIAMAQKIYSNAPESELKQLFDQLQTYGLVRLHPSDSFGFVHYTYLEYFVSLYFLTHATNANKAFISFMRQNLCASRESIVTKFMNFHIGEIDPSRKLETDNTITDCLPNDFEPPSTGRLHPDKLREIHLYLLNHCSEAERYTLIRSSFNLSAFNVLEVLYDSLPTDTKSALKFRFGNKPEPNFINLKKLGANQVVQLLNILLKKNPDKLVRLYLTDFGDSDEDFLEVACRKPFCQVLDWLVDDLIPNLNCEERIALNSYVDHRFVMYLQLIVKHNNARFLQKAIQCAKDLWPKSVILCFLLKRNVLQVFLNTVELPSDTKPLKDEQRVEMVRHIHGLYQWAFDGQFLASDDCCNTIANLQIDTIKCAFNDTFPSL
ncbi:uncharacterized protein LOC135704191 [Ochlerotatus camptorhynchus]|uniref:uncharacterized protein LOC135704191 n=1 Tax=Ochlerotatus camptorhynchus TaxID=644619 RepID=UPI0031E058DC